jgi:hypothetical protein
MTWSMNEIEALSRKAARGAGMSWGLAEEAGKSTRKLLEAGINAPQLLADLLESNDNIAYASLSPMDFGEHWAASGRALCPIAAGACLCDYVDAIKSGGPVVLKQTAYPVFLVPFALGAATSNGCTLKLSWDGIEVYASANGISFSGDLKYLQASLAAHIECCVVESSNGTAAGKANRADVSPEIATRLNALAHRTYAPSTEASRISGAGAGLSDND